VRLPRGHDLFLRLLYAAAGLLAGLAALFFVLYFILYPAMSMFLIYTIFAAAGWAIVGFPIVFFVPSAKWARLPWPVIAAIALASGPLAWFLIYVAFFVFQGDHGEFSLAQNDPGWLFSILVSTVTVVVYAGLLRRHSRQPE
jgi:hypothetical protein